MNFMINPSDVVSILLEDPHTMLYVAIGVIATVIFVSLKLRKTRTK